MVSSHPTGIAASVAAAIAVIDTRVIHTGLSAEDWLVVVGAVAAVVSYFTPRAN